ncbi:MAG: hypothetical protein Q8O14_04450 [bacterium]|nr:hypothetical protein [bacterium]
MRMATWLVLALLLAAAGRPLSAEMCESIGEYEYTYGDNESIMQAKQRCENMALRAAIEQCALFVASTTAIENYELREDLVNTLAAAVVKQKKVLEHRVDGRTIYYKVSVKLDDEQMTRAIESEQRRLQLDRPDGQAQPVRQAVPAPVQAIESSPAAQPSAETPRQDQIQVRPQVRTTLPTARPRSYLALQLGSKSLKKEDWEPLEKQTMFALHLDVPLGSPSLSFALDLLGSAKEDELFGYDVSGSTAELSGALRYYLTKSDSPVRPYAGVGFGFVSAGFEVVDEAKWQGLGAGLVLDAGLVVPLGPLFLGLDYRMSSAKVVLKPDDDDLDDFKVAAGGSMLSLAAGFTW